MTSYPPTCLIQGTELTASRNFTDAHLKALTAFMQGVGNLQVLEESAAYAFKKIFPDCPEEWVKGGFWLNTYDLLEPIEALYTYVESLPSFQEVKERIDTEIKAEQKGAVKAELAKAAVESKGFKPTAKKKAAVDQQQKQIEVLRQQLAELEAQATAV